jgi:type VI secretion system protein ImpA
VILACAALRVEGLAGFRDGLRLIRGLLEKFWGDLHPLLDPDDNNDPQQRLNILSGLTAPRNPGSDVAGWLQIIDYLYQAPICQPRGVAPISLDVLAAAQTPAEPAGDGGTPASSGPSLSVIETQIRSADPQLLVASHAAVKEALEAAEGIDQFLSATLGAGGAISFEELANTLNRIEKAIAAYLPGAEGSAAVESADGSGGAGSAGVGAGPAISGSVRSRDDVVRMIDKICEYYRQVEPGSPVPYLLRRAQKLAVMNFVDAMQELSLATPDQLRPAMGSALPDSPATSAEQ